MVGVPCLLLCQLGPTSRMVWPNFSLWRKGIIHFPSAAVTAKAITETSKNNVPLIFPNPSRCDSVAFARRQPAPVSVLAVSTKVKVITVPCFTCSPASMLWAVTVAVSAEEPLTLICTMFRPAT